MNRRKFIIDSCKSCTLISAGLILGSTLLDSCASLGLAVIKTKAINGKVQIPLTDFEDKKIKIIRVEGMEYDLAVREMEQGKYLTLLLKCTHAGQPLTKTGNGFYCTLHGSEFSANGIVEKGPAAHPLVQLPTVVEGNQLTIILSKQNHKI